MAARLDVHLWDNGGYTPQFMGKVMAWYEAHRLIEQHTRAEVHKAEERLARKKRKK